MNQKFFGPTFFLFFALVSGTAAISETSSNSTVRIRSFLPEQPVTRAQRPTTVSAVIENIGSHPTEPGVTLVLPSQVQTPGKAFQKIYLKPARQKKLSWEIQTDEATECELQLQLNVDSKSVATASLAMQFLQPVKARKLPYIPEPAPVKTPILVGAHHCPLWETDSFKMWANVVKHPERTPALGFYAQENPEVSDWETKWAVEHGINFFVYCWYRSSQGGPVTTKFSSVIHDALFKSRFADKMKFTIMWENQHRGRAGVADEKDLMTNLLPFWIENYFKHPSYLKVDNKPLLFIYRPEFLVDDLGSADNVRRAFDLMRQACRDAGFDGLHLLGEYRGLVPRHLNWLKQLGLDYTFAYCWPVPDNPTPQQAIQTQMEYLKQTQALGILPQVATVSQAWSGWRDEGSIWKIPPRDYETLLRQAKDFIATFPTNELGSKMLLLDNWNEWGEGHYIAPYREYGFGYLDAVRKVFAETPGPHVDLIPEDIGFGPYDRAYKSYQQQQEKLRRAAFKRGETK